MFLSFTGWLRIRNDHAFRDLPTIIAGELPLRARRGVPKDTLTLPILRSTAFAWNPSMAVAKNVLNFLFELAAAQVDVEVRQGKVPRPTLNVDRLGTTLL